MNHIRYFISLFIFVLCTSACFADSSFPSKNSTLKWKPTSASELSSKANENSPNMVSPFGGMQDPFVQGALNGYYNAMQGTTGGSYSAQEMQRQQADYAKQQTEYAKQMDADD